MRKNRVLFVDDDFSVLKTGELILKSLDSNVIFASDGQEAIDILLQDKNFDIIFLDLTMPNKDGFDVLKFLQIHNITIPVIVQTGLISQNTYRKVKNLGATGYIEKPYGRKEIEEMINKHT